MERTDTVRRGHGAAVSAALIVLGALASHGLAALNGSVLHGATASWNGHGEVFSWVLLMLTATVIGFVVQRRHPDNPLGRIFLLGGGLGMLALLADQYAGYALVTRPGELPGGVGARIISYVAFSAVWVAVGVVVPALFPTGRSVSSRWRPVVWLGVFGGVASSAMVFLPDAFRDEGMLGDVPSVTNPLALPSARALIAAISEAGLLALFAAMFLAIISMLVRTKRSRGEERQQIKVVAYTIAVVTVVSLLVANGVNAVSFPGDDVAWAVVSQISVLAVPASLGIALLHYRLYDIDRLINRTMVYAVLTALGAAIYATCVVVFGVITRPFTAGSDLSIAGSTLAIALLFVPLRRRVQRFIDRRFNRTRYDMMRTFEEFAARLRMETDLEALQAVIVQAAHRTMHPAHVSLWFPPERSDSRMLG